MLEEKNEIGPQELPEIRRGMAVRSARALPVVTDAVPDRIALTQLLEPLSTARIHFDGADRVLEPS